MMYPSTRSHIHFGYLVLREKKRKQEYPVTVQVAQNVPAIVLKDY